MPLAQWSTKTSPSPDVTGRRHECMTRWKVNWGTEAKVIWKRVGVKVWARYDAGKRVARHHALRAIPNVHPVVSDFHGH
eukprot:9470560-Pyramimonas_sp.AAC.1